MVNERYEALFRLQEELFIELNKRINELEIRVFDLELELDLKNEENK